MLDFLGIGAQKAGTTWLYRMLALHPEISFLAGKEIHFWDREYHKGVNWYRSLFEIEPGKSKGEITPAYAILPRERIRELHACFPDARILYLIRNPIERAWSSALMALDRAEMRVEEASDQWFIDHFLSEGSLARGDYEACLRRWRDVYPAAQILVARHEEMENRPRELLRAACSHIGVTSGPVEKISEAALSQRIFASTNAAIRPSLLPILRKLYYPKIDALGRYLALDVGAWYI